MRRERRSAHATWILCALVLALVASSAACAEGTQISTGTGEPGTTTTGTGGSGAQGGTAGTAGSGGTAGSTSTAGSGGTAGTVGTGGASAGGAGGSGGSGGSGGTGGAGGCAPDEKLCFNICVPLADPQFGCDDPACAPCDDTNSTPACVGGKCSILKCDATFADCDADASNGCEVSLPTDPLNCGACGAACVVPHGVPGCAASECTIASCDVPWSDCDGLVVNGCETDVEVDPANCGACGTACPPGEQCQGGVCGVYCPPGQANCDGDALNGCETELGTTADCAFCGDACDLANSTADCQADACVVVTCDAGFADCDGVAANGCEVDLETSAADCGACDQVCPSGPNSTPVCAAGLCSLVCAGGFEDCNADPSDGCEQPTQTDPSNCGGCNNVCITPNATPGCAAGVCKIATCNPGFADCDLVVATGCEVSLGSDPAHCGSCATACATPPNASPTCTGGMCGFTCNAGFADCDGQAANGCEVNLQTDTANCGMCANACNLANAASACVAGTCQIASCNAGFESCDGQTANGCEVNLQSDTANCGMCANVCNLANANEICTGGVCAIGACSPPFADCDGMASNGCEINTDSSVSNCGACGSACNVPNGSPACAGGQCLVSNCNAGWANCNNQVADGCEVSTTTDTANCGACGNVCNLANSTEACNNGACAIATCDAGFGDCDGQTSTGCETNLNTNVANCGACGNACNLANATESCDNGTCAIATCNAGFDDCDGQAANGCETNLNSNVANCGACGNQCNLANSTEACNNGACAIATCNAGFGNCDGQTANGCEANLNTNVANCGACGNQCILANASETCSGGMCFVGSCNAGFGNCDGQTANGCETNLNTNVANCGACGNACDLANASETCSGGACFVAGCNAGFGNCDNQAANGCETNLNTTVSDCGACGNQCSLANSTEACNNGACAIGSCDAGFANCDGQTANGCEINTTTNVANCGACGNACNLANSTEACNNGACAIGSCDAGFDDCDGQAANGCEINLDTNVSSCGACGNVCNLANAVEACASGSCAIASCNAGFGNCDGQTATGCETNLNSSVGNCGTCGNACDLANSTEACNNGSCAIGSCDAGFGNCDNQTANGCEINLDTNVSNCGACGNACNLPNATETCTNGACAVSSCQMPFDDCDGQAANGCETNLSTSVTSCGACGNTCNLPNAVPACSAGACAIAACQPGFADCDGQAANGCEVDITTSVGNCGVCGNTCNLANAGEACVAGTCQVASCDAGYANCDGQAANGCEINTNTSLGNCGGCGQVCAPANSTGACSSGSCVIGSCNAGYSNCNGSQADGCEINLQADVQNCGSCGNNCAVACAGNTSLTSCSAGSCQIQSCQSGYYNVDGQCSGGCECQASNVSQSCNTPASLGTVNIGQTVTTSANLVPNGVEAWYTVTFTGNTNASYHPRVRFTNNPGSAFQFDIRTNCAGGTIACGVEGGVSNAVTDWETFKPAANGYTNPIPPVGNNGTILIHVFRKAGSPLTCESYTLTVSN